MAQINVSTRTRGAFCVEVFVVEIPKRWWAVISSDEEQSSDAQR
jgi:hypothetical protein